MAVSYANVNGSQMELTPMRVSFKGPGATAFTDLGGTLSNVVIDIKYPKADIKADQFGSDTVIDRRVKGTVITVTTEIAQVQDKSLWDVVFPAGDYDAGNNTFIFNSAVGTGDLDNAGELLLHPLSKPDSYLDNDFTAFLACGSSESSITYGPDGQAKLKIVWNVLPDTQVIPARFFMYGDRSLITP